MDSPDSDSLSIVQPESVLSTRPAPAPAPPPAADGSTNEHFAVPEIKGLKAFSRKSRKATKSSLQEYTGWEQPPAPRRPYHQYVHDLVQGGWDNLRPLVDYMNVDIEDQELVISVLDISENFKSKRWPDIHDGLVLKNFLDADNRSGVKVRLYLAEQKGSLAAGVMEAFGSSLNLDPRFFQWSIRGNKRSLAPSELHKAPYISMGFGIPKLSTPSRTDAESFRVTIYVLPGEGDTWTGILLFSSHTQIELSSVNICPPPSYRSPRPAPITLAPASLREKYLETFAYLDLAQATASPFYAVSYLFRLNCLFWTQVITSIRDEDRRIQGISDMTIGHVEEIQKSLRCLQRGGSTGWPGAEAKLTVETRLALEEDFKHLVGETELLWQTRGKMASIKQHQSETRWTTLTNTFTYVFAPITIMSGIYGMNVSEISGSNSNPDIWQFFVAVVGLNLVVVLTLAVSNWFHIVQKHGRRAGAREVFGFAVGKAGYERKAV